MGCTSWPRCRIAGGRSRCRSRCRSQSVARFAESGCLKLVESGCMRQTPRMAVPLLATAHSAVFAGARGSSKLAVANCMRSSSGIEFRKRLSKSTAGTVHARRVSRAFRPSVEMGACHRYCARHIRADDPLAVSASDRKHPYRLSYMPCCGGSPRTSITRSAVV